MLGPSDGFLIDPFQQVRPQSRQNHGGRRRTALLLVGVVLTFAVDAAASAAVDLPEHSSAGPVAIETVFQQLMVGPVVVVVQQQGPAQILQLVVVIQGVEQPLHDGGAEEIPAQVEPAQRRRPAGEAPHHAQHGNLGELAMLQFETLQLSERTGHRMLHGPTQMGHVDVGQVNAGQNKMFQTERSCDFAIPAGLCSVPSQGIEQE
jgi:hypothetical protein